MQVMKERSERKREETEKLNGGSGVFAQHNILFYLFECSERKRNNKKKVCSIN